MIKDKIVDKCSSHTLLQQEELDLTKTVKIARNAETAVQEAQLLSQGSKENPIPLTTWVPLVDRNASTVADVVARMAKAHVNVLRLNPLATTVKRCRIYKEFIDPSLKLHDWMMDKILFGV